MKAELAGFPIVDGDADYVGGQQIAGKLDPLVVQAQHLGQSMGQYRLADARNVLDEKVPPGEQTRQAQAHLGVLAENDLVQLPQRVVDQIHLPDRRCFMGQRSHR